MAGAVATALVTRATGTSFKGDPAVVDDRLKAADCVAAHTVPRSALLDLAAAAETARATAGTPPPASGVVQGQ